jgi:hypothetical protein
MCVGVRVYCRRTSTPFFFFFFFNQAVSPQKEKAMCRKVKCTNCQKWTWAGCGQHIESCLAGVPVIFIFIISGLTAVLCLYSKIKDAHVQQQRKKPNCLVTIS